MPSIGFTGIKFCHIGDKEATMRAYRREDTKNREQTYRKRLSSSNIFQPPSYRDLYETFYFYFIFPYQAHTLTLIHTYNHSYIHRYIIIYMLYFSNVELLLIFVDVPDCTTVCMF